MNILLVNVRSEQPKRTSIIYVGRYHPYWGKSILANPFKIGPDGTRNDVIGKYYHWLQAEYLKKGKVYAELNRIAELAKKETLILGCWCFPLDCHAQVIRQAILGIIAKK